MSKKKNPAAHRAPSSSVASPAHGVTAELPTASGRGADGWLPWVLALLAFLLYSTGLHNGMVAMDDHSATVNNPAVRAFDLFGRFNLGMYAPLTWAGYALAYALGKDNPYGYHLLSALVHAFNVVLVYRLFRYLTPGVGQAAVVALLFAVHPLQVEAVSWIAGFSTPLFSFFCLLSLCWYVPYAKGEAGTSRLWVAAVFFLLACLSKSAAVVLPLVMLVVDGWLGRSFSLRLLTEKAAFFAIALGFGMLTLYSRGQAGHTGTETVFSLTDRFWMVSHTLLFYWGKILWPSDLSIWYPFQKVGGAWPLAYLLSPVVVVAVLFAAWRLRHTLPVLWWGLLWYLAHISLSLPWATFGTFELRSDRYNYLAALGVFAVLAALPAWVAARRPAWATGVWALLLAFALGCAVQSVRRIRDWKDTLTLLNRAMAVEGDNFGKAYLWRGMEYGDMQKREAAIEDFNRAIAINPTLIEAYKYRGGLFGMSGKHEQALADLTIYLEKNPDDAEYLFNRGIALRKLGRPQEALADFDRTLRLRPDFTPAYRARANAYADMGDTEKAQADMAEFDRRSGTAKK